MNDNVSCRRLYWGCRKCTNWTCMTFCVLKLWWKVLMITLEVKCLSGQTRGVRVNFRFNQVSSWWRHNHILESVWRLLSVSSSKYLYILLECVAKKRKVYLNTIQQFTMALSCVMISSVIFLKSYMSKSICTETMLKLSNTLALEYCVNYLFDNWRSVQWCKL